MQLIAYGSGFLIGTLFGYLIGYRRGEYKGLTREGSKPSFFYARNKGLKVLPGGKKK